MAVTRRAPFEKKFHHFLGNRMSLRSFASDSFLAEWFFTKLAYIAR
jgi:hypothetical protein